MTDEILATEEQAPANEAVAQDAAAASEASHTEVEQEAAPAPVSAPAVADQAPVEQKSPEVEQKAPAEDPPPPSDKDFEDFSVTLTETITVHNPGALRGVAAGPADHPRVVAAREAAAQK